MNKITKKAYQIDAMGDLGDAGRKISNKEYIKAIELITEILETTQILFNEFNKGVIIK